MTQNNVEIVPMTSDHVCQIAELERICFADPWPEISIQTELTNPLSLWLVAVKDGAVIGYIGSQAVLGEADVMNVAVSPQHRREKIATKLLLALQAALKENRVYSLALEVRVSNEAAISLYRGLGFVQVGRRPNYYHNPKEDALILRKEWSL